MEPRVTPARRIRMRYRTPLTTAACAGTLAATLALAGCGSEDSGGGNSAPSGTVSPSSTASPATSTRLNVQLRTNPKARPTTWTLTCSPTGGDHPRAAAACDNLIKSRDAFQPVPKDAICTEIYGGPQTATVTGTWQGTRVDTRFTRLNGCEIGRWDRLSTLLDPD